MSIVVVERSFATLDACSEVVARARAIVACSLRQPVYLLRSLCARDGRHLLGIYDAPDADAVRVIQDQAALPYDRIWSARQLNVAPAQVDPRYETVVVQRELSHPVLPEQVEAGVRAAHGCYERNRSSFIASLLSLDGLRTLCTYRAPDAESVRNANVQLGLPFTRAWTAIVIDTAPALAGGASSHEGE
jgi:hypothetical protein